uniref:VP2 n=1 Tax=viral metagenome TaxID=1070528 RepID=A0A2V0RLX1_9ZZZZ
MSDKKDETKPKAAQPLVQENQIEDLNKYVEEELGKVDVYGENMTIEKILSDAFYEPTYTSANFIAMMKFAGREDELPKSKESDESKKEEVGSGKDNSVPSGKEKEDKQPEVQNIDNALEVAVEHTAEILTGEGQTEPTKSTTDVIAVADEASQNQSVKILPALGRGGFSLETIGHLNFLKGGGDYVEFDHRKDSLLERNAFYVLNSFVPARKPTTEDLENTEYVPVSAHDLIYQPLAGQLGSLSLLPTKYYAVGNQDNPRRQAFHSDLGGNKVLMQTYERPADETRMPIQDRYVYPENARKNELSFKVFKYLHPSQEDLEYEFGDDLNKTYMGVLREDRLDQQRSNRIYETTRYNRVAFQRPSEERAITAVFLQMPPNPISQYIYKTSRNAGARHLMIANVERQLDMPSRMDGRLIQGFSLVNPTAAATFAKDYVLYLTSSAGGELRPKLDQVNQPDVSKETNALAALAYLCVIDHNLIEPVDMAHLLISLLAPFYDLMDAQIDDQVVEGLITIANKLTANPQDTRLPAIIKTIITRKYDRADNRNVKTKLEAIMRQVFTLRGLQLRRVGVDGPIRGYKDDTYSPFLPNLQDGQTISELIEGKIEVSATQHIGWQEAIISNVRGTGIINAFVEVLDLSRRDGKIGSVLNNSLMHSGSYALTSLAMFTSIMHSAADLELYPAAAAGHRSYEPNGITELDPYGALALLMCGVTVPYLTGENKDGLYDRFNNQYMDLELYTYSPRSSIKLPSNARFRLSLLLSILNEVVEHFRSIRKTVNGASINVFMLDKYPAKVKECAIKCISIYFTLTGDENKLIDLLFNDRERYLGVNSELTFPNLPQVFRDIDNGRFGNEDLPLKGSEGRLIGAAHLNVVGTIDAARAPPAANIADGLRQNMIAAKMSRGYTVNEFTAYRTDAQNRTFSQVRKIEEAVGKRVKTAYISLQTVHHRIDFINNNDTITSMFTMETVPTEDEVIDFTTLLNINYYDNFMQYNLIEIRDLVSNLRAAGLIQIDDRVKYVSIPLEETKYEIIERPELKHDQFDASSIVVNIKRSKFMSENKYTLSSNIPVFCQVTEKLHLLNVVNGRTVLDPRAFNLAFTPIIYVHVTCVTRALVGMELLKDNYLEGTRAAEALHKRSRNLYTEGLVRIRAGNGVVLSEMKPVTSRVKEEATVKDEFSTRLRVV